jgi:hypothetical protein
MRNKVPPKPLRRIRRSSLQAYRGGAKTTKPPSTYHRRKEEKKKLSNVIAEIMAKIAASKQ